MEKCHKIKQIWHTLFHYLKKIEITILTRILLFSVILMLIVKTIGIFAKMTIFFVFLAKIEKNQRGLWVKVTHWHTVKHFGTFGKSFGVKIQAKVNSAATRIIQNKHKILLKSFSLWLRKDYFVGNSSLPTPCLESYKPFHDDFGVWQKIPPRSNNCCRWYFA